MISGIDPEQVDGQGYSLIDIIFRHPEVAQCFVVFHSYLNRKAKNNLVWQSVANGLFSDCDYTWL